VTKPYSPSLEQAGLPNRDDIKTTVNEMLKESLRQPWIQRLGVRRARTNRAPNTRAGLRIAPQPRVKNWWS